MPKKKIETYYDAFIKENSDLSLIFKELKYLNYSENVPYFIHHFEEFKNQNLNKKQKSILYGALNNKEKSQSQIKNNEKMRSFLLYDSLNEGLEFVFQIMDYFKEDLVQYFDTQLNEEPKVLANINKFKKSLNEAIGKGNSDEIQRLKYEIFNHETKMKEKQKLYQEYQLVGDDNIKKLKLLIKMKTFVPYQVRNIEISVEKYQLEQSLNSKDKAKIKTVKI
jgi:hypothetical protein